MRKLRQQRSQFAARKRAIQNLVGRIVVDFGVSDSRGPVLLVQKIVKIPRPVDQGGDPARAAQVHRELELLRLAEALMQHIVQPGPFEVARAHGLRLIAGQQYGRAPFSKVHLAREEQDHEQLQRGQVLHFIHGDAAVFRQRGFLPVRARAKRLGRSPGQSKLRKIAVYQRRFSRPVQAARRFHHAVRGARAQVARSLIAINCFGQAHPFRLGKSPHSFGNRCPHQVRVHLVIEPVDVIRPWSQRTLMVRKIAPELRARGGCIRHVRPRSRQLKEPVRIREDGKGSVAGTEPVEIIAGQRGQVPRKCQVQNAFGLRLIGRMQQRGGLPRARMTLQNPGDASAAGEARL